MHLRTLFLLCSVWSCLVVSAQDYDIYIGGLVTDSTTGAPIPFANVEVTDQTDATFSASSIADANGEFQRELYSGWIQRGGLYLVEFGAPGYVPRMAMVDVSEVKKGKEQGLAWRIRMNVALAPQQEGGTVQAPLLGVCVWHKASSTLRWTEPTAQRAFPIERYVEHRIAAHRAKVDSVSGKAGGLMVDGVVLEHFSSKPLEGVEVRVHTVEGTPVTDSLFRTDHLGYYALWLPYTGVYRLSFGRHDLVTKHIDMHGNTVPEEVKELGFRSSVDIRLFADIPSEDLRFLQEPMGHLRYSTQQANLEWDMAHARPILERLNAILDRHAPAKR